MKKVLTSLIALTVLAGCSSAPAPVANEPCEAAPAAASTEYVDSYTSASATKTTLEGDALSAAQDQLAALGQVFVTKAESEAEGYVAQEGNIHAQIMSTNPDGSVGFSTIGAWNYDKDSNTVSTVLTDGQNAQNLAKENARGTLLVHCEDGWYLVHLKTVKVDVLEYSDEAFNNGEFHRDYSGAPYQLCEWHLTFDVLAVEQTRVVMIP